MSQYPREFLREQISWAEFLRQNPRMAPWLWDLQEGDEIWTFEGGGESGGSSGYIALRQGEFVKDHVTLHWTCAPKHLYLYWNAERPTLAEIAAARALDRRLQEQPVAKVKEMLLASPGVWDAGPSMSWERPQVEELAKKLGIRYEIRYTR